MRIPDLDVGREHAGTAVLEGDLGFDVLAVEIGVERVDQYFVTLADRAAANLARTRQLAVVGVELLVQDEEPVNL